MKSKCKCCESIDLLTCLDLGAGGRLSVSSLQPCVCKPTKPVGPTKPGLHRIILFSLLGLAFLRSHFAGFWLNLTKRFIRSLNETNITISYLTLSQETETLTHCNFCTSSLLKLSSFPKGFRTG